MKSIYLALLIFCVTAYKHKILLQQEHKQLEVQSLLAES